MLIYGVEYKLKIPQENIDKSSNKTPTSNH